MREGSKNLIFAVASFLNGPLTVFDWSFTIIYFSLQMNMSSYPGFEECCNIHDECYDMCNMSRDQCDNSFRICLSESCAKNNNNNNNNNRHQVKCRHLATMMNFAVRAFGCNSYQRAQGDACLCWSKIIRRNNWASCKILVEEEFRVETIRLVF